MNRQRFETKREFVAHAREQFLRSIERNPVNARYLADGMRWNGLPASWLERHYPEELARWHGIEVADRERYEREQAERMAAHAVESDKKERNRRSLRGLLTR